MCTKLSSGKFNKNPGKVSRLHKYAIQLMEIMAVRGKGFLIPQTSRIGSRKTICSGVRNVK